MSEVEEKKKEKRDVLEEMLKEEKERRDTLSDVLQSIIPLMIIPQILPLFQQSLGQTLRETTVNVKVESSAAIIPIDIAAQTAIVAVDIRAQSVTLNVRIEGDANVNIVGQSVTLSVGIERSVTLDVNVTNLVLNVNITSVDSDVVFNVSIASIASNVVFNVSIASSVLLDVNITGSTTTLNVNITGSITTLDVNVTNLVLNVNIASIASDVVFNVNIANVASNVVFNVSIASSVLLNVNIHSASSTAVLNVNIHSTSETAVLKINVSAQSVDVQLTGTFYTLTGYEKKWDVGDYFTPNGGKYYPEGLINYTVPTGKRLVVYGIGVRMFGMLLFGDDHFSTRYPTAGWYYKYYTVGDDLFIEVNKNITQVYGLVISYSQRCVYVELPTPLVFNAGEKLKLVGYTCSYMTYARVTVHAVEIPA